MEIAEIVTGFVTVVSLKGRVDSIHAPVIQEYVLRLIWSGKKHLILDFEGVTFLASAGLRMLLNVAKQIKPLHGRIILSRLPPAVQKILELAGFLPFFEVCGSLEDAADAMLA